MFKKSVLMIFLCYFFSLFSTNAQELNCTVNIDKSQLQINEQQSSSQIFNELKNVIREFMNNRRWTNDQFNQEEKINCNLNIIFTKATIQGEYKATATFLITRPVFNTAYETVLLKVFDESFNFSYLAGQPIIFSENIYTNNLSSLLSYYAYLALTVDYDSFGKLGGDIYAQKLQNVVNFSQNRESGWALSNKIRSKYALSENIMNVQFRPIREGFYTYHRLALDAFQNNPAECQKQMLQYLESFKDVNALRPNSALIRLFFESKSEEIMQIFMTANKEDRKKVHAILTFFESAKASSFKKLLF
ncbi:MAG: DUF4835 family protein [Pseudarcicella sp.]|nr:DUF4835 family protein [Pseudarcicella sp.]MBP6410813.1 DUF4835 family protein [Pseudarcicella sp.]